MNSNKRINKNLLVISEYINELELDNCRLSHSDKVLNNVINEKDKQIEEYQKALDEITSEKIDLDNIIKEVREYIENNLYSDYGYKCTQSKKELLEILDKGDYND